jgi:hypothetical protein
MSPSDPDELGTVPLEAGSTGAPADVELHVTFGGGLKVVPLPPGARITIGRSSTADVRIDDRSLSREHAEIRVDPVPTLRDLGSQNGTRVRGVLIAPNTPLTLAPGEPCHIGLATLVLHVRGAASGGRPPSLRDEMRTHERERIRAALETCAGNQTKAARMLGISRRTLVSRLSEHGLPRPKKGSP